MEDDALNIQPKIDSSKQRFPYCIVWTPLPLISWFIPLIGHTGICTSDGVIHDFAGSYYIGIDDMAFGEPYKYVFLNPDERERSTWDRSLKQADLKFMKEEHNIVSNNCHSHVAEVLCNMQYKDKSNYNMIHIWWLCLTQSRYVSTWHIVKTYVAFVIFIIIILLFKYNL